MISLSDVGLSGCSINCKIMLKIPKKFINNGKTVRFVSNAVCSGENKEGHNERTHLKKFEEIPGPKSYPVVGTLYKYLPYIGEYNIGALDKNSLLNWRRYGGLVREAPGVRLLHVYDPTDIEAVFRQDHRYPARRSHVAMYHYRMNKPHVYNTGGLLSTNGPEWWRLRSTFQKNFTSPQSVKNHVESTDNVVREFVEWIKEKSVSHNEDFLPYLNRLNLEVIGAVAFNERFQSFSPQEQDPNSRSSKTIDAAFWSNSGIMKLDQGFLWRLFKTPVYKKLADSQEYLEKVSTKILIDKMRFFENADDNDNSLLASFLKQPNLDFKDVLGMMVDILMAAIDTTAYTTSFALYHISRNLEVQQKMSNEILALLPTKDAEITPEIISKAVYVRSLYQRKSKIKSSIDWSGPVNSKGVHFERLPHSRRSKYSYIEMILDLHRCNFDNDEEKNINVKLKVFPSDRAKKCSLSEGTVIVTQNMLACRLPQYVKDPLQFKPERWLRGSESYENIHPFLSLPFGFGPRSCIARRLAEQNICIILIRLIREFNINWMGGELGIKTLLINKPDKPVSLSFTSRNE